MTAWDDSLGRKYSMKGDVFYDRLVSEIILVYVSLMYLYRIHSSYCFTFSEYALTRTCIIHCWNSHDPCTLCPSRSSGDSGWIDRREMKILSIHSNPFTRSFGGSLYPSSEGVEPFDRCFA